MNKYRGEVRVLDVLDIRNELYGLRNTLIGWNNEHLIDVVKRDGAGHRKADCEICRQWVAEIMGVERAIRLFGGQPR